MLKCLIKYADGINMDRLSSLFSRFSPRARVFYAGNLCQVSQFDKQDDVGYLHLLRAGELKVAGDGFRERLIKEPSIVFSPKPQSHRLAPVHASGVDMVCASIDLGNGLHNPFVAALPSLMVIPFTEAPDLVTRIEWLFEEANKNECGRSAVLELLTEYLLILLLRYGMDSAQTSGCILTGLGDEKLSRAINAMHDSPEKPWTIESLADIAAMSRARFAHHFKESVGVTPMEYLIDWRFSIARTLLRNGEAVNQVARHVGYQNPAAFIRAFSRRTGKTPREWLIDDSKEQVSTNQGQLREK